MDTGLLVGVAYLVWDDVRCLWLQRLPLFLFTWESSGVRLSWKAQSEPVKGSVAQSWPWRSTHCVVQRCNEALCGYWYDRTKGQGAVRTAIHTFHTICFSHRIHHINGSPFCDSSWLPAYPWREKGERERKPGRCTDTEIGRKIGSGGAPVVRVKGELGFEKGSERVREGVGMGTWCHFFPLFHEDWLQPCHHPHRVNLWQVSSPCSHLMDGEHPSLFGTQWKWLNNSLKPRKTFFSFKLRGNLDSQQELSIKSLSNVKRIK